MQENDDVKQLMKDLKIANLKHQNSQERKELPSSFHEESELLNKNRFKIKRWLKGKKLLTTYLGFEYAVLSLSIKIRTS